MKEHGSNESHITIGAKPEMQEKLCIVSLAKICCTVLQKVDWVSQHIAVRHRNRRNLALHSNRQLCSSDLN